MFALVDCNNFYVSCERVFNPKLRNRPCVVLSNNDGCIVARSNEIKQIGVPMGAPYFQWAEFLRKRRTAVFSSNYTLYADMSERVMDILKSSSQSFEVYSIDEAFFIIENLSKLSLDDFSFELRARVLKWTGIPVSIGIAPTKTLAKIANKLAKKSTKTGFYVLEEEGRERALLKFPVEDIWGIGRQYAKKLKRYGIKNALELSLMNDKWIRDRFTISGLKLVYELRGTPCYEIEETVPLRKQIRCSRSFSSLRSELPEIKEAVSLYTSRAAEKLRRQGSAASTITVSLRTNRHRKDQPQYSPRISCKLLSPTADTFKLTAAATELLIRIYKEGYYYKKAGVLLSYINTASSLQVSFLEKDPYRGKSKALMESLDKINSRWGRETVKLASSGLEQNWQMKREMRSRRFTTCWEEILRV